MQEKQTIPETEPLLLSAEEVAHLLGFSATHWWRMHSAQQVPSPVHIGRLTRWRLAEIKEWVNAGCPPRCKWNTDRKWGTVK